MDNTKEIQERIIALEAELARKNQEMEFKKNESDARMQVMESKLAALLSNQENSGGSAASFGKSKILVKKPDEFTGEIDESLDSFLGHMDLYLMHVPDKDKFNVALSFLGKHAFTWFQVTKNVDKIDSWERLREMLIKRFNPINKVKTARDKLANWKQTGSVKVYNESFLKIIIDIPNISNDEVIDRYMRGLKSYISKELCTHTYDSVTTLMSHALSVEASKSSFNYNLNISKPLEGNRPVPMDISNTRLKFRGQKLIDYQNGACFICHKKGCRANICPERFKANNLEIPSVNNSENELSQ